MQSIKEFRGRYNWLSNFHPSSVDYRNFNYRTKEHAYQASKAKFRSDHDYIAQQVTASAAKKAGNDRTMVKVRAFELYKVDVMYEIVKAWYEQHPEYIEKLLATGQAYIEESNYWGDDFWGTYKGNGKNNLGRIHMLLRKEFAGNKKTKRRLLT